MFRKPFAVVRLISALSMGLVGVVSLSLSTQAASSGIAAALLEVQQNDTSNNVASVTVVTTLSVNEFSERQGSNRGDFDVMMGEGFSDDVDTAVLMACIAENGRDNGETNYPGINFCTAAIDYSRTGGSAGGYFIPVTQAPTGDEFNINVAAAFFSYSNWYGGFARNSGATNGGVNDLFTGSPGLVLGTNYIDRTGGTSTVSLLNFGIDSRTDGVLLVTGGKNEDNYALSQVNSNNGTWNVFVKDNGTDAGSYEQDPVAFVFIPKTNTTVISGRFRADGTRLIYSGPTPAYTVTNVSTGTWRLTIPGYTPSSGVLIISAEGGLSQNQDNIVSYQPEAEGWLIQSRDLPAGGLQTPGGGSEPVASFVFIPADTTATLIAPVNNAQAQINSPQLKVAVSNGAPGSLTVRYYGRVADVNAATDFSVVALPDTQFYTDLAHGALPDMFVAQTEWIVTNRIPRNIAYVVGLGDIVDHGDNNGGTPLSEWRNATNALYRLENPATTFLTYGIPYGTAVGNHDESPNGDSTGTTTFYNQYFGVSHFAGKPYYAGHYGANNNNHFDFFSAGGMDFIVIYLQYDTTLNTNWLNWANDVLRTNQNRRAIMVTHNFGNTSTPVSFSAQGSAIYNAIKTNSNVFMMLAGHVTGEGSRTDTYNGNVIRTFVSDYQGWTNGGNGFMRIIDFSPANNQVVFTTYSPWTDEFHEGPTSEIFFNYNMQAPGGSNGAPFELIGTLSNVPPSTVTSLIWSNRQSNTAYEWYVSVTDELGNLTTGPDWRFSTAPNVPPVGSNTVVNIFADGPTNLVFPLYDANGDPITIQTNTLPQHGVLVNFNTNSVNFTYAPIRGYRGFDQFIFRGRSGSNTTAAYSFNINVVAPPDTNANGLVDTWEHAYGVTNPNADDDGDGLSNVLEYYANTNPTNAASVLRITSVTRTNGNIALGWPTVGGIRYRVQYSNGGASGSFNGTFNDVIRPLNVEMDPAPYGSGSTQSFVDDYTQTGGVPTTGVRYFRIKVIQ